MPTPTYIPLATKTLTGTATSVTFSSISQTYRDLVLVVQAKSSTSYVQMYIRFNGDTATNYNRVNAVGTTFIVSGTGVNDRFIFGGTPYIDTLGYFNSVVNIMDYSVTNKHKNILARNNQPSNAGSGDGANSGTEMFSGRWASTAAITSVLVYPDSNAFAIGSTFTLYGIAS